jgi:hypothetical protein
VTVAAGQAGVVYLLHFDRPYKHARHYLGWTAAGHLDSRIAAHRSGQAARLMAVVEAAGIGFELARTWPGGRTRERQIKRQGGASRCCPMCGVRPRPAAAAVVRPDDSGADYTRALADLAADMWRRTNESLGARMTAAEAVTS